MAEIIGFNPEIQRNDKVEMIKTELVKANFLKPDEKQKDQMSENLGRIFSDQLKHGTNSVAEIEMTINDPAKTEVQTKTAKEDKEILGEAVVLATRELTAKDPSLASELFLGSKHVNNLLPKELKGLGREVTKPFIGSEEIDKQLNLLEVTRQKTDLENPDSVKTLSQKIEMGIDKLIHKDFETEEEIGQQDAVLTILNEEKRKLSGKNNFSNRMVEDVDYEPLTVDPATQEIRGGARWEISPENAAMAMKFMDSSMRWQSYTPPEWFKKIKPIYREDGSIKETAGEIQARIEYMIMVNDAAAGLKWAGKDLDKIQGNKVAFCFTNEQMTRLFNPDFKLVISKMLNDLCEFDTDQNGVKCLRYKERFYLKNKETGKEEIVPDTKENREKGGYWTIDKGVMGNIRDIMGYKDELALFLAKQNGREKANYLDQMNAYAAYNLVFAMGDTSVWDRMRILPTYEGVICDALRTLNPEYKALAKWQVIKSGRVKKDEDLFSAEYFSGPLADWALGIMKMERDLGHKITDEEGNVGHVSEPIDGKKTLRDKIIDRDVFVLANKTYYGFFDFVNGGRDLYDKNGSNFYNKDTDTGRKVSLAELTMHYAFDENGRFIPENEREDFNFGHKTVSFENEFHDSLEGAALAYNCMMGKVDAKDPALWARNLKDKMGMINGIEFNGKSPFKYARDPSFWRDAIIGSFGYDKRRISSDHPYLFRQPEKNGIYPSYNKYIYHLLADTFRLSSIDVNFNKLMRLLGVDVADKEDPNSIRVTTRNNILEDKEIRKSQHLLEMQRRKF